LSDQDIKIRINPKFKVNQYQKAKKAQESTQDQQGPDEPKLPNEEIDLTLFSGKGPLREKKEKIIKLINHMVED
jgi:predicted flap endonuclease-1-like 5' DNA nuclease